MTDEQQRIAELEHDLAEAMDEVESLKAVIRDVAFTLHEAGALPRRPASIDPA